MLCPIYINCSDTKLHSCCKFEYSIQKMVKLKERDKKINSEESNKSKYHPDVGEANSAFANEEINERKYSTRLACSESTKKLIMEDCIEDFLSHHPELSGINVTQNMILRQIAEYYLKH